MIRDWNFSRVDAETQRGKEAKRQRGKEAKQDHLSLRNAPDGVPGKQKQRGPIAKEESGTAPLRISGCGTRRLVWTLRELVDMIEKQVTVTTKIIHGDCLDVLSRFPKDRFDLIVTFRPMLTNGIRHTVASRRSITPIGSQPAAQSFCVS